MNGHLEGAGVRSRLGFLSGTGAVVAVVAVAGLAVWTMIRGPVLFSPGALSVKSRAQTLGGVTSHVQLAGECGACHPAPWSSRTMTDACLGCHSDVSAQLRTRSGLHGLMLDALASPTCRGCHTEHHGANGALTVVDPATFPHDLTGYSLRGHTRTASGGRFACADCHPKGLSHFDQATCADCHAVLDARFMSSHETSFGKDCLVCHKGGRTNFDHSVFPVDHGAEERRPTCQTCHPKGVRSYTCYGCHAHTPARVQGQHEGRPLADLTDCIRCHQGGRKEGGD
jgi:hypothetical protein